MVSCSPWIGPKVGSESIVSAADMEVSIRSDEKDCWSKESASDRESALLSFPSLLLAFLFLSFPPGLRGLILKFSTLEWSLEAEKLVSIHALSTDSGVRDMGVSAVCRGEVVDDVIGEDGDVTGVEGGDNGGDVLGEGNQGLVRIRVLAFGIVL